MAVPDLGFVFVGLNDLSIALGHPFDPEHGVVREHAAIVEDRCREAGVPIGRFAGSDVGSAREAIDDGCGLVYVGSELETIRRAFAATLDRLERGR